MKPKISQNCDKKRRKQHLITNIQVLNIDGEFDIFKK